jgi:hypothetical protein
VRSVFVLTPIETGFPLTIAAFRVGGVGLIGGRIIVRRWGIKIGLAFWIIFELAKTGWMVTFFLNFQDNSEQLRNNFKNKGLYPVPA